MFCVKYATVLKCDLCHLMLNSNQGCSRREAGMPGLALDVYVFIYMLRCSYMPFCNVSLCVLKLCQLSSSGSVSHQAEWPRALSGILAWITLFSRKPCSPPELPGPLRCASIFKMETILVLSEWKNVTTYAQRLKFWIHWCCRSQRFCGCGIAWPLTTSPARTDRRSLGDHIRCLNKVSS